MHKVDFKQGKKLERGSVKSAEKKKMGRPIEPNPKSTNLTIRLDEKTENKLNVLIEKYQVSKAEMIRKLILKAK